MKITMFLLAMIYFFAATGCTTTETDKKLSTEDAIKTEIGVIVNYMNSGDVRTALSRLKVAIRKNPNHLDLNTLMGLLQLSVENNGMAVKYFRKAHKIKPSAQTKFNVATAFIQSKATRQARSVFANILKKYPNYKHKDRVFHNIGYSYAIENKAKKATKYYLKATQENPAYHLSWLQLGKVYGKTGQQAKAISAMRKSVKYCQACAETNFALYDLYFKNGKILQARKLIKNYLGNDNLDPRTQAKAQSLLRKVVAYGKKRR